jgi:hypothetical protein
MLSYSTTQPTVARVVVVVVEVVAVYKMVLYTVVDVDVAYMNDDVDNTELEYTLASLLVVPLVCMVHVEYEGCF